MKTFLFLLLTTVVMAAAPVPKRMSDFPGTNRLQGSNIFLSGVYQYPHPNSTNAEGGTFKIRTDALLPRGQTYYVDALAGSDIFGDGGIYNPFATPYVAKTNAAPGSTIVVRGGTYTSRVTNLFFNGTWVFQGPTFDHMGSCTDNGSGILDDRFSGPVTNYAFGTLQLKWCPGTNFNFDEICSPTGNPNALGAITITNGRSLIQWNVETELGLYGGSPTPRAVYVSNCQTGTVLKTFNRIYNLNPGNRVAVANCPAAPGEPIDVDTGCSGIYWLLGTFHLDYVNIEPMTLYAVESYGVDANDQGDMFLNGNFIDGKWYIVGRSKRWKVWSRAQEYRNTSGNGTLFNFYQTGSHYFEGNKASTKHGPVFGMDNPGSGDTNLVVWVNFNKVSGSNGWASVMHGRLLGRVGHFEQDGPMTTPGIVCTNGAFVSLSGEDGASSTYNFHHAGGEMWLRGYTWRATNAPNGLVTAPGLRLASPALWTGSTNSLVATNGAQTVRFYNAPSANAAAHASVTPLVGTLSVDADVP